MRWRVEAEVVTGKGQFLCANKKCSERSEIVFLLLKITNESFEGANLERGK